MDPISAVTLAQATSGSSATQAAQTAAQGAVALDRNQGVGGTGPSVEASSIAAASRPEAGSMGQAANRVMGNVHATVERLSSEVATVETQAPSPAEAAKKALTPQSGDLAPGGPAPATSDITGPDSNLAMLNKSFDHAMFMAMVNQVISGVGDSSRTLIRQA